MPIGRTPDDLRSLPYTVAEIRLKIRCRAGETLPHRLGRGKGKSKKICIHDLALLARMTKQNLYRFTSGKRQTGLKVLRRLCDVLDLVDSGCVTKTAYGCYHWHSTAQVPPVREMRIDLSSGRITGELRKAAPVRKMPRFERLFGK